MPRSTPDGHGINRPFCSQLTSAPKDCVRGRVPIIRGIYPVTITPWAGPVTSRSLASEDESEGDDSAAPSIYRFAASP
jgi:hypothetical protein